MTDNHVPPVNDFEEPVSQAPETPIEKFLFHQKRALEETGKALDALVPPGFKEHGTEARREFVKGFQILVDAAITELEKAAREMEKNRPTNEDDDRPSTTGPNKVKVQVD